jgi:thymidylate synthase
MKNNVDKQYLKFLKYILDNGVVKSDRTGTGTISVFDYTMKFDMSEGFPLLTSKKMYVRGIFQELIWFLKGDTNIKYLVDNDVHIWNGDAIKNYEKHNGEINWGPFITKEEVFVDMIKNDRKFAEKWGELGPVYGKQWRNWSVSSEYSDGVYYSKDQNIDQIANLIKDLKTNPDSRRLMVLAWNVGELDQMVLPPCHYGFQCYTQVMNKEERIKYFCDSLEKHISYGEDFTMDRLDELNVPKRKISLKWTQRSCDVPLGIPYNIASYGLLLHLLSRETNMVPNELIFSGGDCHIYLNQVDGVEEQLRNKTFSLPKLKLTNTSIDELKYEDIQVVDYKSSPTVKFPLSN